MFIIINSPSKGTLKRRAFHVPLLCIWFGTWKVRELVDTKVGMQRYIHRYFFKLSNSVRWSLIKLQYI
jgi:hypothetical protein